MLHAKGICPLIFQFQAAGGSPNSNLWKYHMPFLSSLLVYCL